MIPLVMANENGKVQNENLPFPKEGGEL